MHAVLEALRTTPLSHGRRLRSTGWPAAVLMAVAPYAVLGISRYSFASVLRPLELIRLVGIGVVGWGILATMIALVAGALDAAPPWPATIRVAAQTHLPLTVTALAMFVLSWALQANDVTRVVAVVTAGLWFPAVVVGATAWAAGVTWGRALLPGIAVVTTWALSAGLPVFRLTRHLL